MKRYLFLIPIVMFFCFHAIAKDEKQDELNQWAKSELAKYPEVVEGVNVMYPTMSDDAKLSISDIIDIEGKSKDEIFTGALVFIHNNMIPEMEALESIDYDSRRFILARKTEQGSGKTTSSYEYIMAFQVADNMLSFVIYDIKAGYREKGILPRKLDLEKLKPQTTERHKELVTEFSYLTSKYLLDMADFIKTSSIHQISHWKEIKAGDVVKGMNESEVKLVFGRPYNERKTGKRIKWMYEDNSVVVFTDGIVSTVIH